MHERISAAQIPTQRGHVYRYELAASLLRPDDTVLDVACGIGYGAKTMGDIVPARYIGVDKVAPDAAFAPLGTFYSDVDLDVWVPDFEWDVTVSFETLEHLSNPQHLATQIGRARRLAVVSVPTRPTKHMNPYHLQDFTVDDVLALFSDLQVVHVEDQPEELSHIFVFACRQGQP
jgi:2-polyprenyl-3-methyl-5-hydroxy-6-metoxy-1,4-benzoquinol methylase